MNDYQNFIHTKQVIIMISREDNLQNYPQDSYEKLKNTVSPIITEIIENMFPEVFKQLYMIESHKITINILGDLDLYHQDPLKAGDTLIKYSNATLFEETESKIIIESILNKYQITGTFFIGNLNFKKIDLTK